MKCQNRLCPTRLLWTRPCVVKSRPASPNHHVRFVRFWDIMQRRVVIPYWRFGTTYQSHLQGSSGLCFWFHAQKHLPWWTTCIQLLSITGHHRNTYFANLLRYISENRTSPMVVMEKWLLKNFKLTTRIKDKTWTNPQIKNQKMRHELEHRHDTEIQNTCTYILTIINTICGENCKSLWV